MMPVYIAQYLCFQSLERTDTQENNKSLQMSKYSAKAIETKDWAKKIFLNNNFVVYKRKQKISSKIENIEIKTIQKISSTKKQDMPPWPMIGDMFPKKSSIFFSPSLIYLLVM